MLREVTVVEQRLRAVMEVLDDGAKIKDVATRYGVDRRTIHRWLLRYANDGLGALEDRSSKPDRCPHQISPEIEARIVAMRKAEPGWGPRTILNKLRRELEEPPSRSAIYRCLVRHRLIDHKPRKRRREDYKRWYRPRPMELWQIDVLGNIKLSDGTRVSAVTGIDDFSRFCVIAKLVERPTAKPVCDALLEGLSKWGVPEQILTDNGRVFTGRLAGRATNVLFDRICLNNGIKHILSAPYAPTTTGKVERLHKTMRHEFFSSASFDTIEELQAALDAWVIDYNHDRENQGIGDVTPIKRFELRRTSSIEVIDGELAAEEPEPKKHVVVRRVDGKGRISILKHRYHVGGYLAGQRVSVESKDGLLHVSHNGTTVATHARRHLPEQDSAMDRRSKTIRPSRPTKGDEVLRKVDPSGSVSFAAISYRVGNRHVGQIVGVRVVGETVQITQDGVLLRTHRARHDKTREFGALSKPFGKPRRTKDVA